MGAEKVEAAEQDKDEWISTAEAAKRYQRSPIDFGTLAKQHNLEAQHKGRTIYYRSADLERVQGSLPATPLPAKRERTAPKRPTHPPTPVAAPIPPAYHAISIHRRTATLDGSGVGREILVVMDHAIVFREVYPLHEQDKCSSAENRALEVYQSYAKLDQLGALPGGLL